MKKLKQGLVFLLGLFVAVFVVTQEVIDTECEEVADKQEQTENDSEEPQEVVYQYNFDALLPISGVTIEPFQAVLLAEINYETQQDEHPVIAEVPLCDSPYYKTLFRQIISPNAP